MADDGNTPPQPGASTSTQSASSDQTIPEGTSAPPPAQVEYKAYDGSMTEYCKQMENWLGRAYWQRECAVSAYYTALGMMYPPWNRGGGGGPATFPNGNFNPGDPHVMNNNNFAEPNLNVQQIPIRGFRTNQNTIVIAFNVAPLWKRVVAECIDFLLLLVVKLFVTFTIIENFELINLDNVDLDALQESGDLIELAMTISWELFVLEVTHRIIVCFFETYCLYKGGATPGKGFMGLRVFDCSNQIIPIRNNTAPGWPPSTSVLVSPGAFLPFQRAFLRSFIKNISLAILFPFCFTLFQFDHSRTMYDLAAKSIVVEIRQE